jgi:hypothetical protein
MAVGLAMTAASAAASAAGAEEQGHASADAARYQSQVAQNNASLAMQQGATNSSLVASQWASKEGQQRAVMGANGVDVNSGSSLASQQGLAEQGGIDVANTKYNYILKSSSDVQQSVLDNTQATNDISAGNMGAMNSLLSGASQFSSKWASWQNPQAAQAAATGSI